MQPCYLRKIFVCFFFGCWSLQYGCFFGFCFHFSVCFFFIPSSVCAFFFSSASSCLLLIILFSSSFFSLFSPTAKIFLTVLLSLRQRDETRMNLRLCTKKRLALIGIRCNVGKRMYNVPNFFSRKTIATEPIYREREHMRERNRETQCITLNTCALLRPTFRIHKCFIAVVAYCTP